MKRVIYKTIIIALILIEIPFMYLTFKSLESFKNKNEEINQETIENNSFNDRENMVSIMLQDDSYDFHEAEDRTKWPDITDYAYAGAKCTDSDGSEIDANSIIKFIESTYSFDINTKNSIYCTLYFAKGRPALEVMHKYSGTTLGGGENGTTAVDGLIRYKGTKDQVKNNFICFGTIDKNKCLSDKNKYMYRIIGITDGSTVNTDLGLKEGQLKLIRASSVGNQAWNSTDTSVTWDTCSLKTYLNGTFLNTIKNGDNGVYWDNVITTQKWIMTINNDASQVKTLTIEKKGTVSKEYKIGLMYASDYVNAGPHSSNTDWLYIAWGQTSICNNSYYDCGYSGYTREWTMTNAGIVSGYSWHIAYNIGNRDDDGYAANYPTVSHPTYGYTFVDKSFSIRPVFYIRPLVNLFGSGSETDPFIITNFSV